MNWYDNGFATIASVIVTIIVPLDKRKMALHIGWIVATILAGLLALVVIVGGLWYRKHWGAHHNAMEEEYR